MSIEEINAHNIIQYKKIYSNLIDKFKNSEIDKEVYTERHHIIPKCMGGSDDSENLVDLPARYHIIAHLLLCRIYQDNPKLVYAAHMMLTASNNGLRKDAQSKISTRTYARIREEYSNALKNTRVSEETKRKMSIAKTGLKRSEETRKKMSETKTGKNHNFYGKHHKKSTRAKMSNAQMGEKNHFYGKHHNLESIRKILFTKSHYIIAPDGTVYENIGKAAKAAVVSRDKLSSWLYSNDTHGYKFLDKNWLKKK